MTIIKIPSLCVRIRSSEISAKTFLHNTCHYNFDTKYLVLVGPSIQAAARSSHRTANFFPDERAMIYRFWRALFDPVSFTTTMMMACFLLLMVMAHSAVLAWRFS